MTAPLADQREVRGWQLYDWANSAFFTTVVAALGGPYLTALAERGARPDGTLVTALGLGVRPGSFVAFAIALSVLVQVPLLPLLGVLADRTGAKKQQLAAGCGVGALATLLLPLATGGSWQLGGALFCLANVAAGCSIVVYNAMLNDIAAPADRDAVSSRGYALGYLGGGLLLAANLGLVLGAERLGISTGTAARLSLASAGVWWAGFGALAVSRLRSRPPEPRGEGSASALADARTTLRELRQLPGTLRFLVAYLLYNDAIQAVISLAAVFLTQELFVGRGRSADDAAPFLLSLVLLIQLVAVAGALGFGRLAARIGARRAVAASLVLWTAAVTYAGLLLESTTEAVGLGVMIGLVLGGSQALSRSLFSRLVPAGREAALYGIYQIAERGTSWVAPLLFGVVQSTTGSYRQAIVSLAVLFVAGLVVLLLTDTDAAERAVAEPA